MNLAVKLNLLPLTVNSAGPAGVLSLSAAAEDHGLCRMAGRFGPNVLVSLVLLLLDLGAFFILVGLTCRLNLRTLLF